MDRHLKRFKDGALDRIMRERRLTSDEQLAALLGVWVTDLPKLRAGAPVTYRLAMRVSLINGHGDNPRELFEDVHDLAAA